MAKGTLQPVISGARAERAIVLAGTIVGATAAEGNGTLPSDKALRQACFTAVRMMAAMDQVLAAIEQEPTLMTTPLDNGDAYAQLHEICRRNPVKPVQSQQSQQSQNEQQSQVPGTEAPPV